MKSTVLPAAPQRSSSSFSIRFRVCTSSALNGSSIRRTGGSTTIDCASCARFRMPPESSCG